MQAKDTASWIERNRTFLLFAMGGAIMMEQVTAAVVGVGFQPILVGAALALMGLDRVLPKSGG